MVARQPQRTTRFTPVWTGLAAIIALPFAVVLAILAVTALLFSGSAVAAPIAALYLFVIVMTPRLVFRRSLGRGHDRAIAVKFAVYSVLAVELPLIPWILAAFSM
jgi:hypothetical protein